MFIIDNFFVLARFVYETLSMEIKFGKLNVYKINVHFAQALKCVCLKNICSLKRIKRALELIQIGEIVGDTANADRMKYQPHNVIIESRD